MVVWKGTSRKAPEMPAGVIAAETAKPATALRVETGREWPRAPLLAAVLFELERRYDDWQRLHTNR